MIRLLAQIPDVGDGVKIAVDSVSGRGDSIYITALGMAFFLLAFGFVIKLITSQNESHKEREKTWYAHAENLENQIDEANKQMQTYNQLLAGQATTIQNLERTLLATNERITQLGNYRPGTAQ